MALQAGAVPFETGFQVCEGLIDVCLKPGSHLLNQFRGRVKAAIHLVLSSVKAPPDLLIGQERSVPQWASRQRPGCWGKKSPRAPSVSNQTSRLVWKQDLQQMFQRKLARPQWRLPIQGLGQAATVLSGLPSGVYRVIREPTIPTQMVFVGCKWGVVLFRQRPGRGPVVGFVGRERCLPIRAVAAYLDCHGSRPSSAPPGAATDRSSIRRDAIVRFKSAAFDIIKIKHLGVCCFGPTFDSTPGEYSELHMPPGDCAGYRGGEPQDDGADSVFNHAANNRNASPPSVAWAPCASRASLSARSRSPPSSARRAA